MLRSTHSRRFARPSPSMVVACIALCVAVAGTTPAWGGPVANSAASLKTTAKKALGLGKKANKTAKKANKTANEAKATAAQALAKGGPPGPTGQQGEPGKNGANGTFGTVTIRSAPYTSGDPVTVHCATGEVAVGGGVETTLQGFARVTMPSPFSGTPTGWRGQIVSSGNTAVSGTVYAVCALR